MDTLMDIRPEPALYYCNYNYEEFKTCNPRNLQEN